MGKSTPENLKVLYQDNHFIAVNKRVGDIVQGDKTSDTPLSDIVKVYLKKTFNKPGNVFLGLPHRLDRPVSGITLFAKTSKGLSRANALFAKNDMTKLYLAIVEKAPPKSQATLSHFLTRNAKSNKSYIHENKVPNSKNCILTYKYLLSLNNYHLLEVQLQTGRHHQIRAQLTHIGCPIKGDLKYGAKRSNKDKGICLHSRELSFNHPISKEKVCILAPLPESPIWKACKI